jgi:hypothetical protein
VENIIFSLKPDETSKPFMLNGQSVTAKILGEEKTEIEPLNDIRPKIKSIIINKKVELEMERWMADLESKTNIQRYPEQFNSIELNLSESKDGGSNGK